MNESRLTSVPSKSKTTTAGATTLLGALAASAIVTFAITLRASTGRDPAPFARYFTLGMLPQSTSESVESMRKCEPLEWRSAWNSSSG
jgi:hypothetical protein